MVKKVVLLLVLAVSVLSGYWSDWNVPLYSTSNPPEASVQFPNSIRVKSIANSDLSKISSQYTWIYNSNCKISCAARSFLTVDPVTNLAVCKRDKSTAGKFWNTVLNSAGQLYPNYCIPKVSFQNQLSCSPIFGDIARNPCSSNNQPPSYAGKGYDCCYSSSSLTSQSAELFNFNAPATDNQNVLLTTLVNSEP